MSEILGKGKGGRGVWDGEASSRGLASSNLSDATISTYGLQHSHVVSQEVHAYSKSPTTD
jgi:hypothetical protein